MKRWILLFVLSTVGCGNQTLPTIGHSLPSSPAQDPKAAANCVSAKAVADQWIEAHPEISKTSKVILPSGQCEVAIQVAANADLALVYNLIQQQSGKAGAIKVQTGFVGVWLEQDDRTPHNKSTTAQPAISTDADCKAAQAAIHAQFPLPTLTVVDLNARLLFNSTCYVKMVFAASADLESFLSTPHSTYSLSGDLLHANVVHKDGSVATIHMHLESKN